MHIGIRDDERGYHSGSAYVFEKDVFSGNWTEVDKLTALDGAAKDNFGSSVSVSGNTAIVGAWSDDDNGDNSGSAYLFERDESSGNWTQVDKLTASDGAAGVFSAIVYQCLETQSLLVHVGTMIRVIPLALYMCLRRVISLVNGQK